MNEMLISIVLAVGGIGAFIIFLMYAVLAMVREDAYNRGYEVGRNEERESFLKNSWTVKLNQAMEDAMTFKPSKFQGTGFVDGGAIWKREEIKEG